MHSHTRLNGIKQLHDKSADGQPRHVMELPLPLPPAVLTPPSLSVALWHIPSLAHKIHTHTHRPIPGKYKYILCCCNKAITNMAVFLANKSRTYRSSLDCQQNKSQTWQRHIQAESADKQKPIGACMCVYGQPPHTSSAPPRCGLPAT